MKNPPTLRLEEGPEAAPRFLRIARGLIAEIRRGRLVPGQRLPGSRALARELQVHRNTVLAAVDELKSQGWLTTSPWRGTFVSAELPEVSQGPSPRGLARLGFEPRELALSERGPEVMARGTLAMSGGSPDPRLVPVEALARAWRRVVRRGGQRLLEYGSPAGHPGLRRALATFVANVRGVPARSENVLVTRGSQMALDLCARALLGPGDVVAVEAVGYAPAWDALKLSGSRLVSVRVDREGLDVDALEQLARRAPLRAVYLTPHHQYPTTVTMSAGRRLQLLRLARSRRFAILEDDYDHEFHYEGRPVLPLASADDAGVVVYVGTLSKVLAPGLRLGFMVAPSELLERLVSLRAVMDRQGDHPMEAAVADLLDDGELQRHVRKMRLAYLARRGALLDGLGGLGPDFSFDVPPGGIGVWLRGGNLVAFERWRQACAAQGVLLAPGARYVFGREPLAATRVVFSRYSVAELRRATGVMRAAWHAVSPNSKTGRTGARRE